MLQLIFLLFALAPCAVKGSVLNHFEVSLAQPLNPSKVTSVNTQCTYLSSASITKPEQQAEVAQPSSPQNFFFETGEANLLVPVSFLAESRAPGPPLYILYKRLKIAAA